MLLCEKDRTFSSKHKFYTQRTKELTNELKDAQREFDNPNIGTPEYFEVIKVMNEIATLNAELSRHQELEKKLKDLSVEIMKTQKKALDEYEKNRTFFENTCNRKTKDVLAQYRIYRQAYISMCFIGSHVMKLMKNAEEIINKIT